MKNRTIYYLAGIALLTIGILFLFNLSSMFINPFPEHYIGHNRIKGMAIQHDGILFTLNFSQQNEAVDLINQAVTTSATDSFKQQSQQDFQKLVIYRFNAPDITITPITMIDNSYIFSVPEFSENLLLKDTSQGRLKNVLSESYE